MGRDIWEPLDDMAYRVECKLNIEDLVKSSGLPRSVIEKTLINAIELKLMKLKKKSPPKSPKLKRYYLKPGKSVDKTVTFWTLSEGGKEIDFWHNKKEAIVFSSAYIRSHGGGSLRIMLRNGKFQEERTYPKGRDPRRSKG